MFTKKQTTILLILLAILVSGVFLYKERFQSWPWQKKINIASPSVTVSPTPSAPAGSSQAKTEREKIMEDAASRIAELSPVAPVLGGQWFAERFWFIQGSDKDFYVEYEDGHILRRLLLRTEPKDDRYQYKVAAYFEAGESDWVLKNGQDQQFGKSLDLYEYDENNKKWVKKN